MDRRVRQRQGELPALLARLKQEYAAVFEKYFGQFGLDVTSIRKGAPVNPGIKPSGFFMLSGEKLSNAANKERLRTLEWAYRFWTAGHDDIVRGVEIKQTMDRIHIFYRNPKHTIGDRFIADYVTSEYGVALLLDQHVNRPGHVPKTLRQAVSMADSDEDPSIWSDDDERKLLDIYIDLRSDTSMTDSDKRAQVIADAVTKGVISDQRNSFAG